MSTLVRYKCLNCGKRFEVEVLSKEEKEDYRRKKRPLYQIACPECKRIDVRPGWE
jgi:DNA-directed RNA polymerase subunit RPC12/RpoP